MDEADIPIARLTKGFEFLFQAHDLNIVGDKRVLKPMQPIHTVVGGGFGNANRCITIVGKALAISGPAGSFESDKGVKPNLGPAQHRRYIRRAMHPDDFFVESEGFDSMPDRRLNVELLEKLRRGPLQQHDDLEAAIALSRLVRTGATHECHATRTVVLQMCPLSQPRDPHS